ncbi:hypothetical protein HMPREF1869_01214 [Bacteroidales bacterium KA00251]|nr:hypothetical protein HMPREF1869_01214 [Bacteroidales bacterium KA00251]
MWNSSRVFRGGLGKGLHEFLQTTMKKKGQHGGSSQNRVGKVKSI